MKPVVSYLLSLLLQCWMQSKEAKCEEESVSGIDSDACTLYIAPSTLSITGDSNAGQRHSLGIFTAIERQAGDTLVASDDVCFPFIDTYWHHPVEYTNPYLESFRHGRDLGMWTESITGTVDAFCPGLNCHVQCQVGLVNVFQPLPSRSTTYNDGKGDDNQADPATAGSRTPYGVQPSIVVRKIPAGGELFKFNGDEWLTSPSRFVGNKDSSQDSHHLSAQTLLQQFAQVVYDQSLGTEDMQSMIAEIQNHPETPRALSDLPDSLRNCLTTTERGANKQARHTRSLSWLEENGRCVDNITSGPSTIPGAGKGAFARHKLHAGQVVTSSPLHHYAQLDFPVMEIYNITKGKLVTPSDKEEEEEDDEDEDALKSRYERQLDQRVNDQIALNYCFGHAETSLLLCPYGPGVNFINHGPEPNLMIRWANDFAGHDENVVESTSLEDLDGMQPTLSFDYVAQRDIEEGEELFLSYGSDWQEAFSDYLDAWNEGHTNKRDRYYASSNQWNEMFSSAPIRTNDEQAIDPYPDHIQIRCHYDIATGFSPSNYHWKSGDYGFPCTISDRFVEEGTFLYTVDVQVWPEPGYDNKRPQPSTVRRILRTDIPRHALRFFDEPGTSNLNLSGTFRHWIALPDSMLPFQWRNLSEEDDEEVNEEEEEDGEEDED